MKKHAVRPRLESLEARSLLSLILDMDTGINDPAPPGTAMLPLNFAALPLTVSGDASGHGTLMARIASEHGAILIDEACASADGLIQPYAILAAARYDAKYYAGTGAVVAIPAAGMLDPLDGYSATTLLLAFRILARAGIPVVCSAGDAGTNNDELPFWPAAARSYGATNVLPIAGTDPATHALQSWSNYGPASVPVAVPSIYGTSESAILGAIALGAQLDATPRPRGVRGPAYAAAVVNATIAGATHDEALAGLVGGGEITDLGHTIPLVFPAGIKAHHHHHHRWHRS